MYFPLEIGRYWVLFNPDGDFLTLEFTSEKTLTDVDTLVLTYTYDRYPLEDEVPSPIYEQYYALDPEQGILLYGYKDYEEGEYATYLPGILFAGSHMELEEPVTTTTAASGQLALFVTTLAAQGMAQSYYGDFQDSIDITMGPDGADPSQHFLANGYGFVKFEWKGSRYQLYDYGTRAEVDAGE